MASLSSDQIEEVESLQSLDEFVAFISELFQVDDIDSDFSLKAIGDFDLKQLKYDYQINPAKHLFTWDAGISVAQDEISTAVSEKDLDASILIEIEDDLKLYPRSYSGQINLPVGNGSRELTFELCFLDHEPLSWSPSHNIIPASLDVEKGIGEAVSLAQLVSQVSPSLVDLIPEELREEFVLQRNIVLVIDSPGKDEKKRLLFSLDFSLPIRFSQIPVVGGLVSKTLLASQFVFELLVSLQQFSQTDLITINHFLKEGDLKLVTTAPTVASNELLRGINIDSFLDIDGSILAWLLPLLRPGGGLDLGPDPDGPITITDDGIWLTIEKSFGSIYIQKIGLIYKDQELLLTLECDFVNFQLGQFLELGEILSSSYLSTYGLSIEIPLLKSFDSKTLIFNVDAVGGEVVFPHAHLGLFLSAYIELGPPPEEDLGLSTPAMEFAGSADLTLMENSTVLSFMISAIGAYMDNDDDLEKPLVFLYAALNNPIGGLPFFFVTGLTLGVGYNYGLKIPRLEDLAEFPLVAEVLEGVGEVDPDQAHEVIVQELERLDKYIFPSEGSGFGALGLIFNCGRMLDGFGLVTVGITDGNFDLSLTGLGRLQVPAFLQNTRISPIAVAEVALQAVFSLSDGYIMLRGQLTSNSYVISNKCHLTGGFGYGLWFSGANAGDFVMTQGGYHPRFRIPYHYPDVPRLGFEWQIDRHAYTTAQVYFALCGHGVMMGGLFAIYYGLAGIWAGFDAGLDFLIGWKPYHYDTDMRLHVRAGMGSVSVGLGADIHFWGPDFGCKFKIDIILFSITIKIGDQTSVYAPPIPWEEFKESFLPEPENVCSISPVDGVAGTVIRNPNDPATKEEVWVINPTTFQMATDSLIPTKQALVGDTDQGITTNQGLGITSMSVKVDELKTTHKVTVLRQGASAEEKFRFEPITKLAPSGVWGVSDLVNYQVVPPEVDDEPFIEDVFFGFHIIPAEPPKPGASDEVDAEHLKYDAELVPDSYVWENLTAFGADLTYSDDDRRQKIKETVVSNPKREQLLEALGMDVTPVNVDSAIADGFIFVPQVR